MEPETPLPWPLFLLFPCLPKKEKTNKTMLWTEAVYSGLGTTWMPCLYAPVKGGHQVCKVWPQGMDGASGPLLLSSAVPFYPN